MNGGTCCQTCSEAAKTIRLSPGTVRNTDARLVSRFEIAPSVRAVRAAGEAHRLRQEFGFVFITTQLDVNTMLSQSRGKTLICLSKNNPLLSDN